MGFIHGDGPGPYHIVPRVKGTFQDQGTVLFNRPNSFAERFLQMLINSFQQSHNKSLPA
jgi:hypothetical protein